MERAWFARGILFVLGLGLLIPGSGCFGAADNEPEGRICASPLEGGTYCVNASSGPDAAWNEAIAHGSERIQMWAVWPKNQELKDVVSSPALLDAWLDDVQTVLDYLRVTRGNAESYQASLSGKLGDDLRRARQVQSEMVREPIDPVVFVEGDFFSNAIKEETPVNAQIWAKKEALGEMQLVVDQAKIDGTPFATQYKAFVNEFLTYRVTEDAESLSNRSSLEISCNGALRNVACG